MSVSTILPPLLGGVLIGINALLLLWLGGRIAGVSGIVGGLLAAPRDDRGWRLQDGAPDGRAAPLYGDLADPLAGCDRQAAPATTSASSSTSGPAPRPRHLERSRPDRRRGP